MGRKSTTANPPPFPLWLHSGTGQWAKKIRGRMSYFGRDKDTALAEYVRVKDDLEAGRVPRPPSDGGLSVASLVNEFLTARKYDVDSGELSYRQWTEYHATADRVVSAFGKGRAVADLRPEDFGKLRATTAKRLGPFSLAKFVQMVRTIFHFAADNDLIDRPVRYGTQFDKPSLKTLRVQRAKSPPKMLTAAECRILIDAATGQLRAMLLLALNGGLGPTDLATLTRPAVRDGWLDFPRPKTGVCRRIPLWPESVTALTEIETSRPDPADPADAEKVFLTVQGRPWVRFAETGPHGGKAVRVDSIAQELRKLAQPAGVTIPGGLYVCRHVFRTVADGMNDRVAIDAIMGHVDPSMGAVYREWIDDARLVAVTDHVRTWLFRGSDHA